MSSRPSIPIGVAVVGLGHWGPNLLRNFHDDPRSRILWAIDQNPERLAYVLARYPGVQVSTFVASALDDPAVDAVIIAAPARTHAKLAEAALQANKHCFVEKPLTTDLLAAQKLVALAKAKQLTLAVGHVFLYNPAIRQAKCYIDDGTLGNPYYASMVRTNLGPPGIDVNVAWDLATHDISIANYWFNAAPIAAAAHGGNWMMPEHEDTIFASLIYPGHRLVHITASWLSPRKMRDITLVGSQSMVTIDDTDSVEPLRVHDKGIENGHTPEFIDSFGAFRAKVRNGGVRIPQLKAGEPLQNECQDFLRCILDGSMPLASGESALSVIRTVEAINTSLHHGGHEELL